MAKSRKGYYRKSNKRKSNNRKSNYRKTNSKKIKKNSQKLRRRKTNKRRRNRRTMKGGSLYRAALARSASQHRLTAKNRKRVSNAWSKIRQKNFLNERGGVDENKSHEGKGRGMPSPLGQESVEIQGLTLPNIKLEESNTDNYSSYNNLTAGNLTVVNTTSLNKARKDLMGKTKSKKSMFRRLRLRRPSLPSFGPRLSGPRRRSKHSFKHNPLNLGNINENKES